MFHTSFYDHLFLLFCNISVWLNFSATLTSFLIGFQLRVVNQFQSWIKKIQNLDIINVCTAISRTWLPHNLCFWCFFNQLNIFNKVSSLVTELFIRERKLNIFFAFISQSYFKMPKTIRLNMTYYFIMKIPDKRELQQIALNQSPDIELKGYPRYKMITSQNILSEAQIENWSSVLKIFKFLYFQLSHNLPNMWLHNEY